LSLFVLLFNLYLNYKVSWSHLILSGGSPDIASGLGTVEVWKVCDISALPANIANINIFKCLVFCNVHQSDFDPHI